MQNLSSDIFKCRPPSKTPSVYEADETESSGMFVALYGALQPSLRSEMGHQLEGMLQDCRFHGKACNLSDFTSFNSMSYGNCFTFQSTKKDVRDGYGKLSGLSLELDTEYREYLKIPGFPSSVGLRVLVHPADVFPDPENSGIDVSPGFETSLELHQITVRRLKYPFEDQCVDYFLKQNLTNRQGCLRDCIQKLAHKTCGCSDPFWPTPEESSPCNMTVNSKVCCLQDIRTNLSQSFADCDCPPPCREQDYTITSSFSSMDAKEAGKRNILRLRVYLKTLDYMVFKNSAKFQVQDILSGLGGQLGLWLGLSLIKISDQICGVIEHILRKKVKVSGQFWWLKRNPVGTTSNS